jgi:hypothetical protein
VPSEVNTTWRTLPLLDLTYCEGARIAVEVIYFWCVNSGGAGFQTRTREWTELGIASVDEPSRIFDPRSC